MKRSATAWPWCRARLTRQRGTSSSAGPAQDETPVDDTGNGSLTPQMLRVLTSGCLILQKQALTCGNVEWGDWGLNPGPTDYESP